MQRNTPKNSTSACEILEKLLKNPPKPQTTHIKVIGFSLGALALPSIAASKMDTYDKHIADVVRADAACRNSMIVDDRTRSSTELSFTTKEDYDTEQEKNQKLDQHLGQEFSKIKCSK